MSDIGSTSQSQVPLQIVSHPSLPAVFSDSSVALAYILPLLKSTEFFSNLAQGKNQKELELCLEELNDQSPLDCSFSRKTNTLYFNLYNDKFKGQLQIDETGNIYYGSITDKITIVPVMYLLYRLLVDNRCPWKFELLEKSWSMNSTIAKSLFCYKNQKKPIFLKGIILKSNLLNETKIHDIGKALNNLTSLENLQRFELNPVVFSLNATDVNRKTLFGKDLDQESLFNYIQFGTTRRNSWWHPKIEIEALAILDNIQFVFSDHVYYSIKDLLHHPYSVFLPQEIFPSSLESKNRFSNYQFWTNPLSLENEQSLKMTNIATVFLDRFIEMQDFKTKKLKLYLTSLEQSVSVLTPYLLIEGIQFPENFNSNIWKIYENKIIGSYKETELVSEEAQNSSFYFSKVSKNIFMSSFPLQKKLFLKLARRSNFNIELIKDTPNFIEAKIETTTNLAQFKMEFDQTFSKQFNLSLNTEEVIILSDALIDLNIFLDPLPENVFQLSFNIDVRIPESSSIYSLSGIPQFLFRCLGGITEGLGQFFYEYDNKDIALQKQGDKRKNDLKLLRHAGIFKMLMSEIINHLNKPIIEKIKIKDFEKMLVKKAVSLLLNLPPSIGDEKTKSIKHEEQISSRVKGLIRELNQTFCTESLLDTYLFSDEINTFQVDLKDPILKLLESIMEWIVFCYGESSLTKTQMKELSCTNMRGSASTRLLIHQEETINNFSLFESSELSKGVLAGLNRELYDVYVSGQKIKPMSEEYFSTSIIMGENHGKIDWFDLHPQIFFNGLEITYEQLHEMKKKDIIFFEGTPYHINFNKMPKLKFLDLFWERLKNPKASKSHKNSSEATIFRQEKSLLLEVLSMRNAGININSCDEWIKTCRDFDSLMENKIDDLNRHDFLVPLKDYQKKGTQWLLNLYKIGLGGVLADDMGLGKTIQAIGFLDILRLEQQSNFHLIVVPTSLVYNWIAEIKKFAPKLEVQVFESRFKKVYDESWKLSPPKIVIMTYGLLTENTDFLNQYSWNSVIFDEAQNLKNISSQRASAARSLKTKSTFCITGTPMENHYGEFYSLIDLCVPGALGDYQDFMRTFSIDNISSQKEEMNFLRKKTSPLVLRRMKSEIMEELPEKAESSILIPFEKQQKEIYRDIAISWNDKIKSVISQDGESNTQLQMLTALMRLRQICSDPSMVEKIHYNKIPPKFDLLYESVAEIYEKGESVLIFTNFVATLLEIEKHFRAIGLKTHSIHGAMNAKKRQHELHNFQGNGEGNEAASILIMTLKTGGVGLNLTKASYVFHVEPWWNPATENQATDRAHRIGQTKSVQVYRYLMKDSVEEKIQDLKNLKGQAFDALFSHESEEELVGQKRFSGQMSYSEFQHLLS
jgi:superfamily II DNA or RNA helicase